MLAPIDFECFDHDLITTQANSQQLKIILKDYQQKIDTAFFKIIAFQSQEFKKLLQWRTQLIDQLLQFLWRHALIAQKNICLIAVGGYGRIALFPYSDIDILILHQNELSAELKEKINVFLTAIWDLGFTIGHSVRIEIDCLQQSRTDLSIYTNLLEMRFVTGDLLYFKKFSRIFQIEYMWNNQAFFRAKEHELLTRQLKYSETAYLLEPDLKYSPGALRDLHHISWLCLQHFQTADFICLVAKNILEMKDLQILLDAEIILEKIRYALHLINKKDDNRLFFDKQLQLAEEFGYKNTAVHKAVEAFMKFYFIQIKEIRALHEIIVQHFYEISILKDAVPVILDQHYELIGNLISIKKNISISKNPELLLQTFLQLANYPTAIGFTASTLTQLRHHLYLIDIAYRHNPLHQQLFLRIFSTHSVFNVLKEMNRHKILGKYLTEFEPIIGQTQYGIFHLYTVDQHILFVIKKIEALKTENIFYKEIFQRLSQPELLYLAALFHDIGKGRNTDHSLYGFQIALEFSKQHHLPEKDGKLVAWLVKQHLLMSKTAQKQDINDKKIIAAFAKIVKDEHRLNYLYLLTVADIQATNENLWNSWKDSLLKQLYFNAYNYLSSAPAKQNKQQNIDLKKQTILTQFPSNQANEIQALWQQLGNDYFYKELSQHIQWHTQAIINSNISADNILVATQNQQQHGATEIFIYCKDRDNLFANTVLLLDRLQLNVVDAKIITSENGFCLDTFSVLDRKNQIITDHETLNNIAFTLRTELVKENFNPLITKRYISRQLAHFTADVQLKFLTLKRLGLTKLTIQATDRPGFLAAIGYAFRGLNIRVHNAKISTIGTQIEDVFYISDRQNNPFKNRSKQIELMKVIKEYT